MGGDWVRLEREGAAEMATPSIGLSVTDTAQDINQNSDQPAREDSSCHPPRDVTFDLACPIGGEAIRP